ncbi:ankyrin repeat and LEM domain-containing protein 1-like [Rhipicephalus sanguineus]|uniref:ankyrin repeat and LEM domain-containing protein 1-like n=1 Tax=Rhipicephalus sanguineus TaxID=34632 RepID=UPI0018958A76|nr:ankyrin repeat and LEM domain-containing protein 1-like [Rhipicephalus sanguineus]
MSPPRPGGGGEGYVLLRSDIVFKTLQRKDSVLFDKLVRHGSLTDFVLPDSDDGMTLLHLVVSVDEFSAEFLDKLLDSGADPNAASADGVTALHIAAASGNEEALRRLLGRGGDPWRSRPHGQRRVDILVANEHWDCLRLERRFRCFDIVADVSPCVSTASDVSTETESLLNTAFVFPHPYLSPVYVDDERPRLRRRERGTAADDCDAAHRDKSAWPATSESSFEDGSRSYNGNGEVANPTDDSSWASSNLSQELLRLSDEELREQLAACCGHDVGPVLDSNRNVHRHALAHYRLGPRARVRLASPDASYGSASNGNDRAGLARTCDFCEVVHRDPDTGFVLKEEHYHSSSEADSSGTTGASSSGPENDTVVVPPELACLTNEQVFAKLRSLGDAPGPVTDGTRAVYLNRLARLTLGLATLHKSRDVVPPDIHTLVLNAANLDAYAELEVAMMSDFDAPRPNSYWREGNAKGSFTYLLLDTRVTRNLPLRAHGLTLAERMADFLKAVFYVGKGKRSRPFSHLYEALLVRKGMDKSSQKKEVEKTRKILQIWDSRNGVVSLHVFQNTLAVEAYTREACMIDAIGLRRLTNQKKGDVYGVVRSWPEKKRRKLGAYLVYKALNIFLSEGERHLGPLDL